MSKFVSLVYDVDDGDYVVMDTLNDGEFLTMKGVADEYMEAIKLFRKIQMEANPNAT